MDWNIVMVGFYHWDLVFDFLNVDTRLHRKKDLACLLFKERHFFDFASRKATPPPGKSGSFFFFFWDKRLFRCWFLLLLDLFFVCVSVQITRKKCLTTFFAFSPTLNNTHTYTYKYMDGVSHAPRWTTSELTVENVSSGQETWCMQPKEQCQSSTAGGVACVRRAKR